MSDERGDDEGVGGGENTNEDPERSVIDGEQHPPADEPVATGINNNVNDENLNSEDRRPLSSELQRRRTEALERILLASDSNLSLPRVQSPNDPRRIRLDMSRRLGLRSQSRNLLNRRLFSRDNLESAIFIPIRTRSSTSGTSLPTMSSSHQDTARTLRNLITNSSRGTNIGGRHSESNTRNGQRVNVSTFFMELTYSTDPHHFQNLFKNSTETQRRRMDVHAANTLSLIKAYCPVKLNKMSQFRCCIKTQRFDRLDFKSINVKPLDDLDPGQMKCNTKVIVIVRDECESSWGSPCTSYLLSYLNKKHIHPTCITFQSDASLSELIDELHDLRAFVEKLNVHDPRAAKQMKSLLIMSTLAKLLENWNIPVLVLDSCPSGIIDLESVMSFAQRYQIKTLDLNSDGGGTSKQWKAVARRVGKQVRTTVVGCNVNRIGNDLARRVKTLSSPGNDSSSCSKERNSKSAASLIGDDCRRIVYNLHERVGLHYSDSSATNALLVHTPRISLLEDGILADIENSVAFGGNPGVRKGGSRSGRKYNSNNCSTRGASHTSNRELEFKRGARSNPVSRPRTSYSQKSEEDVIIPAVGFATTARDQGKVSDLLFNELNQRWRIHGPQRFLPSAPDCNPYCDPLLDTEKQLLFSVLQEVANFEMLKDIRNELKDSKKDLEGRLYGYNPDFVNLIASAEEFLHGKAACMEPCEDEMNFYKLPISMVYSESEVKYMKTKPPLYVIAGESPNQTIKAAMEESTKMFLEAVIHSSCNTRKIPESRQAQTRAIVVIEDNNEVLELLTMALWFFEKTPLATFQSKYYHCTDDFLLSLDACRLYFGTYPRYTGRKDERAFERWLGVGMNGILRSHSSKILLIDLPRPGMPLVHAKKVLLTRLKIEEKLHGIKSFIIGSPTRKEDNLSTVEYLVDEIQKCLKPRDKLLFRKARRMYLDLKLYKQSEQKSRQDVKCLKEWGLPEPENEHDFWEVIRNSDLVINAPIIHPPEISYGLPEFRELTAVSRDENYDEMSGTVLTDIESGDPISETYKVDMLHSEDEITLNDTLLETITTNHDSETLEELDEPFLKQTDTGGLTDSNEQILTEFPDYELPSITTASIEHICNDNEQDEKVIAQYDDETRNAEVKGESAREEATYSPITLFECSKKEELSDSDESGELLPKEIFVEEPKITKTSSSKPRNKHAYLKRSPGILNLLDENVFTEKCDYFSNLGVISDHNSGNASEVSDDPTDVSERYTKLEFTLEPELNSRESSPACIPIQTEICACKDEKLRVESSTSSCQHFPDLLIGKTQSETGPRKPEKPSLRKRSLHEKCVAHLTKWGKSFSNLIKTNRPRRVFPERQNETLAPPPCNHEVSTESEGDPKRAPQRIQVISVDSSVSVADLCNTRESNNTGWLRNLMRYISGQSLKNPFRTKVLYKRAHQ